MPVEIRELVIQAQVVGGHQKSDPSDTFTTAAPKQKKKDKMQIDKDLAIQLSDLLNEFRSDFQKELESWVKAYIAQQNRRF